MTGSVAAFGDDLRHVNSFDYRHKVALTLCGKQIRSVGGPAGGPCPVCRPSEAHPLAGVWAACRRWDDKFNHGLESAK